MSALNCLSIGLGLLSASLWFLSGAVRIPMIGKSIDDFDRVEELTAALDRQSDWNKWAAIATALAVLAGVWR